MGSGHIISQVEPMPSSEYSYKEMKEALLKNDLERLLQQERFMRLMGIPEEEIIRVLISMAENPTVDSIAWPPRVTGLDLMAQVPSLGEFESYYPAYFQPYSRGFDNWANISNVNPYPNNPTPDPLGSVKTDPSLSRTYNITNPPTEPTPNWLGLASDVNSEPPTVGVTGYNVKASAPISIQGIYPYPDMPHITIPPSDNAPQFQEQEYEPALATYVYTSHEQDDVCRGFNGKVFDLNDMVHRPVVPSEELGYTTTHPNCKCYWREQATTKKKIKTADKKQQRDISNIKRHITRKASQGKLHTVKPDGSLSNRTRKSNPMREALLEIREEFGWLSDDYISKARNITNDNGGQLYLIRAASEAITDHRREGEPLRRKLSGDELKRLARTAISKGADVNHDPSLRTGANVIDSEYDDKSKQIQMLLLETDPEIINAINHGVITAVSINGGSPRSESVEPCDEHCVSNCELCLVPTGVVLGELDDIALTWVVTDPNGLSWRGQKIEPATPGVKTTAIQPL